MENIIFNKQTPPVSSQHIAASGLELRLDAEGLNVYRASKKLGAFNDVEWGYGASSMLFIKSYPITLISVPYIQDKI
jgi:hypothetical protein